MDDFIDQCGNMVVIKEEGYIFCVAEAIPVFISMASSL